jgi:hypothetical protein
MPCGKQSKVKPWCQKQKAQMAIEIEVTARRKAEARKAHDTKYQALAIENLKTMVGSWNLLPGNFRFRNGSGRHVDVTLLPTGEVVTEVVVAALAPGKAWLPSPVFPLPGASADYWPGQDDYQYFAVAESDLGFVELGWFLREGQWFVARQTNPAVITESQGVYTYTTLTAPWYRPDCEVWVGATDSTDWKLSAPGACNEVQFLSGKEAYVAMGPPPPNVESVPSDDGLFISEQFSFAPVVSPVVSPDGSVAGSSVAAVGWQTPPVSEAGDETWALGLLADESIGRPTIWEPTPPASGSGCFDTVAGTIDPRLLPLQH